MHGRAGIGPEPDERRESLRVSRVGERVKHTEGVKGFENAVKLGNAVWAIRASFAESGMAKAEGKKGSA